MDPIQPIGPRPPWVAELVAAQTLSLSRERRKQAGEDEQRRPRRPPRKPDGPDEDTPDGRHIDIRA